MEGEEDDSGGTASRRRQPVIRKLLAQRRFQDLADAGARVIKVERPGGDIARFRPRAAYLIAASNLSSEKT